MGKFDYGAVKFKKRDTGGAAVNRAVKRDKSFSFINDESPGGTPYNPMDDTQHGQDVPMQKDDSRFQNKRGGKVKR